MKFVYCPFIDQNDYDTDIQYNNIEELASDIENIKCYSLQYAVLDALSLEYYFTIEIQ